MGYYLDIKKNEILPCATTWMDLEDITFCKTNQGETNTLLSLMWNLKNKQTNNECNKTNRLTDTENKLAVTNSEMQWGINRYTLLNIKQINSKVLLYSTGNYIQYLVITYNGKESEKYTYN